MAELRCDYNPFQASIAAFPAAIRHRRSDQVAPNVQSGFDQNIRGRQRKVSLQVSHSRLERVATGFRWAEGPVYFPAGRYVLFSDNPNNRIMRFSEDDGHVSVYRQPSMNSNGNTIDREGRLCEHSGRRVTRTELDGSITIIADKYDGKKLNSPNDAVVTSDGAIWFTDDSRRATLRGSPRGAFGDNAMIE